MCSLSLPYTRRPVVGEILLLFAQTVNDLFEATAAGYVVDIFRHRLHHAHELNAEQYKVL